MEGRTYTERLLAGEAVPRAAFELEIDGDLSPFYTVSGSAIVAGMIRCRLLTIISRPDEPRELVQLRH